jgi:molecular chaperone HscB
MNYFEFFSLPVQYDINQIDLEKRYHSIQRAFHPDKLTTKSSEERIIALNHSIGANKAYSTLSNSLLRAKYLLLLANVNIDQEIRHNSSNELIQESFSDRELLEETDNIEALGTLLQKTKNDALDIEAYLVEDFKQLTNKQAIFKTIRLQYKTKLMHEIKDKIKKMR